MGVGVERVSATEAVCVPDKDTSWLRVMVCDVVPATLGVTLGKPVMLGDSVKTVVKVWVADCVSEPLCVWERLGVAVSVTVTEGVALDTG